MLFIPFDDINSIGGPATFMRNLKKYLDDVNFNYSLYPNKTKGIFFPIQFDLFTLAEFKWQNGAIIQRLDGIYYPSKHGKSYIKKNERIKEIYHNFATHIIFQSEYSKKQCFEMFGKKEIGEYSIIYNGVDKKIFFPSEKGRYKLGEKIKFITTGNFRNIDMIEPIILALDKLSDKFDFELLIIGPIDSNRFNSLLNRNYLKLLGPKELPQLAKFLRESDIFIYSHLNPPCPNSVIEAISSGVPIVGFDSGSMSELCHFSRDLLVPVSNNIFQDYIEFDHLKLSKTVQMTVEKFDQIKERALKNISHFDLVDIGAQYVNVFKKQTSNSRKISFSIWQEKFNFLKNQFSIWQNKTYG